MFLDRETVQTENLLVRIAELSASLKREVRDEHGGCATCLNVSRAFALVSHSCALLIGQDVDHTEFKLLYFRDPTKRLLDVRHAVVLCIASVLLLYWLHIAVNSLA